MHNHLFFVCPTDHLEPIVNLTYEGENYFITSLGNSIAFDEKMIAKVNHLIDQKQIDKIIFVLAYSNKLVNDALSGHCRVEVLDEFCNDLVRKNERIGRLYSLDDQLLMVLNHHLMDKISELKNGLNGTRYKLPIISATIYQWNGIFKEVNQNFSFKNCVCLN